MPQAEDTSTGRARAIASKAMVPNDSTVDGRIKASISSIRS
jgi:hypothetical protein